MKRRILSLALALMMCLALLPTAAFAADGDLTIENGVLTKYNGSNYGPNYVDIVVPDGVTKIGEQAFNNCFVLSGDPPRQRDHDWGRRVFRLPASAQNQPSRQRDDD